MSKKEKEHMSWKDFDEACRYLATQIKNSKFEPEIIFTIPRGGFPVATRMAHLLSTKEEILNIDIDLKGIEENFVNVLFIDDIADTGKTILENFPRTFNTKIATLYYKPNTSKVKPNFYAFETDKWIVFPWEEK